MRRRLIFTFCLGGLLLLSACGKKEEATGAKTETRAAHPVGEHWGLQLEGIDIPELTGSTVSVRAVPGNMLHYSFSGPGQTTNLDLKDVKPGQTGTFKAYSLQIVTTSPGYFCSATQANRDTNATVTIAPQDLGIHATIEGTVSCYLSSPGAIRDLQPATVHAWFEK